MDNLFFWLRFKILKDESRRLSTHANTKVSLFVESNGSIYAYQSTTGWPVDINSLFPRCTKVKRRDSITSKIRQLLGAMNGQAQAGEEQPLLQRTVDGENEAGDQTDENETFLKVSGPDPL